ncbi:hypothetical protein ACHAWU_010398 [Discostella pseudostelligera]|uniref:MYND-type domain-containing protein n=1 Tax=Discostella pseudostelligera TaxID=259834 RepID=A0ABD3MNH1_9STRA
MTLSVLPNSLVRKKSFDASVNSKATLPETENNGADKDMRSGIQMTRKHSGIISHDKKETKIEADTILNESVGTNSPSTQRPTPPPPHGYPLPGYPGMMPMAPGMGMHPMYMMPPMPMGCYSYNCGPYPPPPYGRGEGGSRCNSRRSVGWCYGGHPDITEIDVDGESYDSRDSCITLMCAEPFQKAGHLITQVLDSWANNVNFAMDYGETLCHPVDTEKTDGSSLLNLLKGKESSEEVAVSQNEKNAEVEDEPKVEKTAPTADEATVEDNALVQVNESVDKNNVEVPSDEVKDTKGQNDVTDKVVKKGQPIRFFQRMKNLNPLKALDMSAISKDSEVNDLSGDADVKVVLAEPQGAATNLVTKPTDTTSHQKNYFLNEISFDFSPEGVTIQEIATEIQPEAPVVDTNAIKTVAANFDSNPPIVASAINAKNSVVSKRSEKKMMKFPRVNSRYVKLGAKDESSQGVVQSVEKQPFVTNFPTDVALDSNGFPILSQHNTKSSTWECAFGNSNPFSSGDAFGISSPVSVAAQFETRSCSWCGKGGTDTAAAKKLKLCSACQTTYYCSAECQSKDWIDNHSKTCQPIYSAESN